MNKLTELTKKIKEKVLTKEVILYIVFGVFNTFVNLVSFYILDTRLNIQENIANSIAIILSVLLAYYTNKDMVFHSNAKDLKDRFKQFIKFISGRGFTMIIEWGGCAILFLTPIPNIIVKLAMTVIVVILNFFISKFFAFKK